ncbi:MAG: hypothetical protein IJ137_03990 [Eubacterium sp.]|nr:hypothetical protein [Eubacterium sp.]
MLNDLFRTYKKIIIAVVLLLSAIIFWFFGCHRLRTDQDEGISWEQIEEGVSSFRFETRQIRGTITFGTDGHLSADRVQPVVLNLTSIAKDFAGTIKITLPGEEGKGVAYQSAISCSRGISSELILEIPLLGNVSFFGVEIFDQYGTEELAEMILGTSAIIPDVDTDDLTENKSIYIGVLSDNYDSLKWMNGLKLESGSSQQVVNLLNIDKKNLWSNVKKLSSLSGILIDDFDTSTLSVRQKNCLKEWVQKEGGSLLIGTGVRAGEVLSGIRDLTGIEAGGKYEDSLQFYGDEESAGYIPMSLNRLKWNETDAWETDSLSHPVSSYRMQSGRGRIMVLAWSLTDDALKQWTGREKMVRSLFGSCFPTEGQPYTVDEDASWYLKKSLYSFLNSQTPSTFYYALFFMAYLSALVFFAYYLLRRTRRRENIWIVVPVIAFFFTLCLMIRTRGFGGDMHSTYSALKLVDTDQEESSVFFLFQNNEGESSNINLIPEVTRVSPLDYSYRTGSEDVASLKRLVQDYTINNTRNGYDIAFSEAVPGTAQMLQFIMKDEDLEKEKDCFLLDLDAGLTSFAGTLVNNSEYSFDKVILIRGREYCILNDVEPGQEILIRDSAVTCWSGYDQEVIGEDLEDNRSAAGSLVEYIRNLYMNDREDYNQVIAAGITEDKKIRFFADDHILQNDLMIVVNRTGLPAEKKTYYIADINASCLTEEFRSASLVQDVLEENRTEAVYQFDSDKVVWNLARNRDSFEGTIYAHNYDTGRDDKILSKPDQVMSCEELEPYISEMNNLTLTFRLKKNAEYGGAPVLSLVLKDVNR